MAQGLLNGEAELAGGGCVLTVDTVDERSEGTTIELVCNGTHHWVADLQLAPDPTAHVRSDQRSWLARIWPTAGLVILAGDESALLIDLATGEVRRQLHLELIGRVDLLDCLVDDDLGLALIVSTRRFWLVDRAGAADWIATVGPVTGIVSLGADRLVLAEYDLTDPDLAVVEVPYPVTDPADADPAGGVAGGGVAGG